MLKTIKTLLGVNDNSKDDVLNSLITLCSGEFKDITHTTTVIDNIVVQMVIHRYSLLGSEGLNSESYSGFSYNYKIEYPEYIYKQIIAHRVLRTL